MKTLKQISTIILGLILIVSSCKNGNNEEEYVKKVQLKRETIAVGIYKPAGINQLDFDYIAEAINIDAGMVYVSLTDEDILKTKIENIDVLVIPGIYQENDVLNEDMLGILKNFVLANGKSIIAMEGSVSYLISEDYNPLDIKGISIQKDDNATNGLLAFNLESDGEQFLPELIGFDKLFAFKYGNITYNIDLEKSNATILAKVNSKDVTSPLIISQECGLGKVLFVNAHLESTPGMRWIFPRMVRWTQGKPTPSYKSNIVRPDLYKAEIIINESFQKEIEALKVQLKEGTKNEALEVFEEINSYYPWLFAEEIRPYLIGRNDELKFKAAEFMIENEYTLALKDFDLSIQTERNRKNKALLKEYKVSLQQMTEQN